MRHSNRKVSIVDRNDGSLHLNDEETESRARVLDRLGGIDLDDPAIGEIIKRILFLKFRGHDVEDPEVIAEAIKEGRRAYAEDPEPIKMEPALRAAGGRLAPNYFVYYMRLGPLVKIGCTCNLKQRLKTINPESLLATEPGDFQLEAHLHTEFKKYRQHGEWYRLEGELAEHIDELRRTSFDSSWGPWPDRPGSLKSA